MAFGNFKNEFSWSKTRAETLKQCERKYWFSHYGFWNGWSRNIDDRTREIYILKKLSNRHAWAGIAVHEAIESIALKLKSGISSDTIKPDEQVEKAIERFRQQYRVSLSARNRENPKTYFRLSEHEYEQELDKQTWVETKEKMATSLRNFFSSDAWLTLKDLPPNRIISCEELDSFKFDGTKIWVSLDLALKEENESISIWDWKTGEISEDGINEDIQLGMYLRFASKKWETENINASLQGLYPDYKKLEISFSDFNWEVFESEIRKSIALMKSFLTDEENNTTSEEKFKKTAQENSPALCEYCHFRRVCLKE